MPTVVVDFDPAVDDPPKFGGDSSDLVYFLSWAFSARYGGGHELSLVSLLLRGEYKIDLRPLLTFADREVEMEADAEAMERAWQDAAPLAECCEAVVLALNGADQRFAEVLRDFASLRDRIADLGAIARWAAARGLRLRVTYEMGDG